MGEDTIRYLLYVSGKWRWRPTKVCGLGGFRLVTFGRELTVQAKARASALNAEWDRAWSRSGGRCGRSWRRSVTPPTKMVRGRTHLAFSNTAPDPQQDGWHHAEVV